MDLQKVYDRLTRHEGCKLKVYTDTEGHPTIGIGRALDTNGITLDEARYLLVNDVQRTITALRQRFAWFDHLDSVRQEVCVNMAFNLGVGGFAAFKNTIQAIEERRFGDGAREMLDSHWAQQVGGRAVELARAMESGRWPEAI